MRRKLLLGALAVICLSILAYGTVAYFTAEDVAHNVITSGGVKIALQEWADDNKTVPFPQDGVNGVLPGSEVTKIVEVKNTGASAAFVRVKVEKIFALDDATAQGDESLILLNINDAAWTLNGGYYYYNQALEPGETTAPLFTTVGFDKTMDNLYQNCQIGVSIVAYATQAANNGDSPLTANGWPT